ncbi:MAG: ketoacyl-ACP synthase III [Cellulosilyticum sp.]|nr:ketoacyl-ACP synthase III [Cellulosilyticum sp.]
MIGIKIIGLGKSIPQRCLTNDEMSTFVDTSDEWIKSRTGISKRHVAVTETVETLATMAAKEALVSANLLADAIDMVIVATVSAETTMPSTASLVARNIGANRARCFDLSAACSGFIFASEVAISMMKQSGYKNILVIGAEVLSNRLDWEDRGTCVIFGDGAGAVIYQLSQEENQILSIETGTDASGAELITLPVQAEESPFYKGKSKRPVIGMDGRKVYVFATTKVPESIEKVVTNAKLSLENIDWFILHQANSRIMDSVAQKLSVPKERFFKNIQDYGNTSAASIPMALYDASSQFKSGDQIVLSGFGAGLTWGTMLLRWS